MKFKINPKFESLQRALSEFEYNKLKEAIKRDGLLQPIALWQEQIIDGHHRYKICQELKIEPSAVEIQHLEDEDDVFIWIYENAISRRNTNVFCRAEDVLAIEEALEAKARLNLKTREKNQPFLSRGKAEKNRDLKFHVDRELAKIANVGHATINRVRTIFEFKSQEQDIPQEKRIITDELLYDLRYNEKSIMNTFQEIKSEKFKELRDLLYNVRSGLTICLDYTKSLDNNYDRLFDSIEKFRNLYPKASITELNDKLKNRAKNLIKNQNKSHHYLLTQLLKLIDEIENNLSSE